MTENKHIFYYNHTLLKKHIEGCRKYALVSTQRDKGGHWVIFKTVLKKIENDPFLHCEDDLYCYEVYLRPLKTNGK